MNVVLPCTLFFKTSIDSGECPSLWKYADITPVYKKVTRRWPVIIVLLVICQLCAD